MDQQETTETNYERVTTDGLDDIPNYFSKDIFNERIDFKMFFGNADSYSIPMEVHSRFENNVTTYYKIYLLLSFIIFSPSLFIGPFKFFLFESILNICLYIFSSKMKKISFFGLSPTYVSIIYASILFTFCFFSSKLLIWLLYLIVISGCSLHALTRIHVEEVLTSGI